MLSLMKNSISTVVIGFASYNKFRWSSQDFNHAPLFMQFKLSVGREG